MHNPLTERGHHETVDSRRYCDGCLLFVRSGFRWRRCERLRQMDGLGRILSAFRYPPSSRFPRSLILHGEQFEFVRALYVAIPPVSRMLPPGDHAVMASSDGSVMLVLVADGQARARFLAPDFIQAMLIQVGQRVTVGLGTPL